MFDYEHDRTSKLHQSIHIHHQAESQESSSEGWTGDWSVYPLESLRQSAAEHSCSHGDVAAHTNRQTTLTPVFPTGGPREVVPTVFWWTNTRLTLSPELPAMISARTLRVAGRQREWPIQGAAEGQSWTFLACHGQALWSVRKGSQAVLCSAGTFGICSY